MNKWTPEKTERYLDLVAQELNGNLTNEDQIELDDLELQCEAVILTRHSSTRRINRNYLQLLIEKRKKENKYYIAAQKTI